MTGGESMWVVQSPSISEGPHPPDLANCMLEMFKGGGMFILYEFFLVVMP